jgi:MFS family permease
VTSNFASRYRYTGAALTSDLAWFIGAGFAPLVALGLSSKFGLIWVTVYLLSGVVCTWAALLFNKLETREMSSSKVVSPAVTASSPGQNWAPRSH